MSHCWKYGGHLSVAARGGWKKALETAENEWKAQIVQVFLSNNRSFTPAKVLDDKTLDVISSSPVDICVHAKYLYNFARAPADVAYQRAALLSEMRAASQIAEAKKSSGKIGVTIHMGKNVKDMNISLEKAYEHYIANVKMVLAEAEREKLRAQIWLENAAGAGTEFGESVGSLAYLYNKFDEKTKKQHLGITIDSCHAFVAAAFKNGAEDAIDAYFLALDNAIGLEHIKLIHMNDSKVEHGARSDRHEQLKKGKIDARALKRFVQWSKALHLPMVLETPSDGSYAQEIEFIAQWASQSVEKALPLETSGGSGGGGGGSGTLAATSEHKTTNTKKRVKIASK